jgi:hypothetical protein
MVRSAIATFADKANRCPTWVERDGRRLVNVQGFSPVENLVYGVIAAAMILSPIGLFLVVAA